MPILPTIPDLYRCIEDMWPILIPVRPRGHTHSDELELVRRRQRLQHLLLFESKRDGVLDGFSLVQVLSSKALHM